MLAIPADVLHTWDVAEQHGWALFPVHAVIQGLCTCGLRIDGDAHSSAGKHPRTRDGFKSATPHRSQWEAWYAGYDGQLNWGLATGQVSGNILVIDIDGRHDGYASLAALKAEVGEIPQTLEVSSGSGSPHYYYLVPPSLSVASSNRFRSGIDIKADGGYVIIPPASHASGGFYEWRSLQPIADIPPRLLSIITEKTTDAGQYDGAIFGLSDAQLLNGMHEGQRDEYIFKACCRWFERHRGDRAAVEVLAMYTASQCTPAFLDWRAKVDQAEKYYHRGVTRQAAEDAESGIRRLVLTKASDIQIAPVKWLWDQRVALGVISLLGGREGIGKSTVAYDMVARITKGELPGCYVGQPRSVIVCATEDSWSHTINPRLMAAGADLEKVFRVNVRVSKELEMEISLPDDLDDLTELAIGQRAAMLLLDPLLSRLDGKLDTHKDAEVRRALEPLAKMAERANVSVLGLIHVNKSTSADPLNLLMASRAFAAMARAVLFAMTDDDDESLRHLGQAKNNLGRTDLPTLDYRIESAHVADSDEGPITTGKISWIGESVKSIRELLQTTSDTLRGKSDNDDSPGSPGEEVKIWLEDFLTLGGGSALSADVKKYGKLEGYSISAIERARLKLSIIVSYTTETPRRSIWALFTGEKGLE